MVYVCVYVCVCVEACVYVLSLHNCLFVCFVASGRANAVVLCVCVTMMCALWQRVDVSQRGRKKKNVDASPIVIQFGVDPTKQVMTLCICVVCVCVCVCVTVMCVVV